MQIEMTETYQSWHSKLKDLVVRARIQARIERLRLGNPGHHRVLTDGVIELKLDFGAGYRVYFTQKTMYLLSYWLVVTNPVNKLISKQPFSWLEISRSAT